MMLNLFKFLFPLHLLRHLDKSRAIINFSSSPLYCSLEITAFWIRQCFKNTWWLCELKIDSMPADVVMMRTSYSYHISSTLLLEVLHLSLLKRPSPVPPMELSVWEKSILCSMLSPASLPLDGQIAIITGASRGRGKAVAIHLHSLGAKVAINYASNSTQADLIASELNASGTSSYPRAIAIKSDISDPDQVKRLFDRAEQEFSSKVHILVNCAGVMDPKYPTLANTSVDDWDMTFNVNTRGAFLCCKEAANRLAHGGGGRIILTSTSVVGFPMPGYAAYAASKAATETMAKTLAKELKGTRISVNCVAPGPVATELFFAGKTEEMINRVVDACPLGRLGEPKDVSKVVGFLARDDGEWINGQIIRANGGFVV